MENVNPPQAGAWFFRDGAGANTIRFCTANMAGGQPLYFVGSSAGTKWYGNIMVGAGTITDGGNTGDFAGTDYNFYPSNPTFNWGGVSFATWKAAGLDTHSLTGNPLFNYSTSSDYTLQAGSPCINAAGGVPAVASPDAAGTTRPQGSAPDMGAYEYGGAPTPPVITSATTASGTIGQAFSYQITARESDQLHGHRASIRAQRQCRQRTDQRNADARRHKHGGPRRHWRRRNRDNESDHHHTAPCRAGHHQFHHSYGHAFAGVQLPDRGLWQPHKL